MTMADKLMQVPNDYTQNFNYWLKRLNTQLNEPTNKSP